MIPFVRKARRFAFYSPRPFLSFKWAIFRAVLRKFIRLTTRIKNVCAYKPLRRNLQPINILIANGFRHYATITLSSLNRLVARRPTAGKQPGEALVPFCSREQENVFTLTDE